jgi:alpha-tubulin suppressor-like RCC1 family protein
VLGRHVDRDPRRHEFHKHSRYARLRQRTGRDECGQRRPQLGLFRRFNGLRSIAARRIASDEEFISVSVGDHYACGATIDGVGYCWGSNRDLQIGAITTEYCTFARTRCTTRPVRVSGKQRFSMVSAGLGAHVCGVTDQYNLYCWGAGSFGQRGDGTTTSISRVPRLAAAVAGQ